ncbi:MAG: ATP-binding protein [Proteobacteria bacterium]|nr:ATP-binding protein [Desulfobacteraceae bacterium]MBL7172503.1 ATP-binding protein [Desulfobacteraceae bacterium]MBU0735904.1 ATP-binding protein [Pseudomonadota bacterium]MBU1903822.1 ATP-binding protein [Pseudomonadota bacterium]
MKRDIYADLLTWKSSSRRKPLLLQGARQTGKTFILKEFGRTEYRNTAYCNFEEDPALGDFFQRDLDPQRILAELSVYLNLQIQPGADLVIFDEIQVSDRALNSLKYFAEKKSDVHIAAAGSLLGLKLSGPGSFPVGKVNFLQLYPMTFMEFLDAMGQSRYRNLIEHIEKIEPLTEAFHVYLIDMLRRYYFVGGMPEAVRHFAEKGDGLETREIQKEIIKSYALDFAKHAPATDIPKLTLVWGSIPKHLARENKKFVFSAVRKGARAREFENALMWLNDSGLIHRADAVQTVRHPLAHYADSSCFKVYALDVGLLGAMAGSPVDLLVHGERLFNEYEGAFVESYVAQQLVSHFGQPLYYWRSKGGKGELDFLCEFAGKIYPLEVKAGINPKSKSLRSYNVQFQPDRLIRTNLLNLRRDGSLLNLPLYAISILPSVIG